MGSQSVWWHVLDIVFAALPQGLFIGRMHLSEQAQAGTRLVLTAQQQRTGLETWIGV